MWGRKPRSWANVTNLGIKLNQSNSVAGRNKNNSVHNDDDHDGDDDNDDVNRISNMPVMILEHWPAEFKGRIHQNATECQSILI